MAKKIDTPMIVARYGDRVAGWVGTETGGMLYGDTEWVESAKAAAAAGLEFTLYEDIELKADIDDPKNPAGAFAALAWFAKERISIKKAPEGMLTALGLLEEPEILTPEDLPDDFTDEEKEFYATHLRLEIDDEPVYVPLASLKATDAMPASITKVFSEMLAAKK